MRCRLALKIDHITFYLFILSSLLSSLALPSSGIIALRCRVPRDTHLKDRIAR